MKTKIQNFTGEIIYVGIDVHFKSWKIALFTQSTALKKFTLSPPSATKLVETLNAKFPGATFKCCYEAGFSGFWAQRKLKELGVETIIVNPADIPTSNKDIRRKTDSRDASKIGRELRAGNLEGIYIPTKELEEVRSVVRFRSQIVKDERRIKQRIKMYFHFAGYPADFINLNWSQKNIDHLKQIAANRCDHCLQMNLNQLEKIRESKKEISDWIKKLSKSAQFSKISYLLQSVPGISVLSSMILISEIMEIKRFSTLDKLCSYVGLVPDTNESADNLKNRGITRRSNRKIRTILMESTWIAIRQDPSLSKKYINYCKRMAGSKAIVKVARSYLSRIRWVWLNESPYQIGIN